MRETFKDQMSKREMEMEEIVGKLERNEQERKKNNEENGKLKEEK
jgi:hypothetical protein